MQRLNGPRVTKSWLDPRRAFTPDDHTPASRLRDGRRCQARGTGKDDEEGNEARRDEQPGGQPNPYGLRRVPAIARKLSQSQARRMAVPTRRAPQTSSRAGPATASFSSHSSTIRAWPRSHRPTFRASGWSSAATRTSPRSAGSGARSSCRRPNRLLARVNASVDSPRGRLHGKPARLIGERLAETSTAPSSSWTSTRAACTQETTGSGELPSRSASAIRPAQPRKLRSRLRRRDGQTVVK